MFLILFHHFIHLPHPARAPGSQQLVLQPQPLASGTGVISCFPWKQSHRNQGLGEDQELLASGALGPSWGARLLARSPTLVREAGRWAGGAVRSEGLLGSGRCSGNPHGTPHWSPARPLRPRSRQHGSVSRVLTKVPGAVCILFHLRDNPCNK